MHLVLLEECQQFTNTGEESGEIAVSIAIETQIVFHHFIDLAFAHDLQ